MHLWVTYSLVQFSSYGALKSFASVPTSNLLTGLINFCAGAGASLIATAFTYPLDIMRTQFAIQVKNESHPSMLISLNKGKRENPSIDVVVLSEHLSLAGCER
jgi:hypothetical protein